jgi:hypothetical protein
MPIVKSAPASSVVPSPGADIVDRIIGTAPAPLLPGEAEADYLGVAARIVAVAQPKDAIEEFLTRDVVDLTWEVFRLRRLKAALLRAAASKGVHRILLTIGYPGNETADNSPPSGRLGMMLAFAMILKKC